MPVLFTKDNKMLCLETEQCKGCELCIEVCPVKALEPSRELNTRGVFPPGLTAEGKCTLCTLCEYMCPDMALYIIEKPAG